MLRRITTPAAVTALAATLTVGFAGPAVAAPQLKEPKIKDVASTQTFFPNVNYYLVETTVSWKPVKGADVYLVCSLYNGGQTTCATGIHDTTYTDSLNGVPAGTILSYFVVACDTVTGPAEVCTQSKGVDVRVGS